MIGGADPLATIKDAVELIGFDEVILSTAPVRLSGWPRLDLARPVRSLGVLVTTVVAEERRDTVPAA